MTIGLPPKQSSISFNFPSIGPSKGGIKTKKHFKKRNRKTKRNRKKKRSSINKHLVKKLRNMHNIIS